VKLGNEGVRLNDLRTDIQHKILLFYLIVP